MIKSALLQMPSLRGCSHNLTRWMSSQIQSTATPVDPSVIPQTAGQTTEPDKLYSRLEIECRGIDPAVLKSYNWFATTAAEHLGIEVGKWSVLHTFRL